MTAVYHFDSQDRFYIGTDEATSCQITGEPMLPAFATFQPPPILATNLDQIAIFISEDQGWTTGKNDYWRPPFSVREVLLGNPIDGNLSVIQAPFHQLTKYPGVHLVISPITLAMAFSGRLAYMQRRAEEVQALYARRMLGLGMEEHHYQKIATEDIVLQMKRFVDDIFMHEWIALEGRSAEFLRNRVIKVCSVQDAENKIRKSPTKDYLMSLKDSDPQFFDVLADLRNSFVHHLPVAEAYRLTGIDHLTINTFHMREGQLNQMERITVFLEDLIKSFNRFIHRSFSL